MVNTFNSDVEILSSVEDDYRLIVRRYSDRYFKEYDKIRRRNKIDKEAEFPKCFQFRTPSKNNWMCFVSKAESEKSYKGEDYSAISFFLYYYDDYGIRVFHPTMNFYTSIYNSSVFNTYGKKMNLEYQDQLELIKHYMTYNRITYLHYQKEQNKIDVLGIVRDGFLFGEYIPDVRIVIYKDFITKDMVNLIPEDRKKLIVQQLERDILRQLDNDDPFHDRYFFLTKLMTSLNQIDGFNTIKVK